MGAAGAIGCRNRVPNDCRDTPAVFFMIAATRRLSFSFSFSSLAHIGQGRPGRGRRYWVPELGD
jgi:hypothetical protein